MALLVDLMRMMFPAVFYRPGGIEGVFSGLIAFFIPPGPVIYNVGVSWAPIILARTLG